MQSKTFIPYVIFVCICCNYNTIAPVKNSPETDYLPADIAAKIPRDKNPYSVINEIPLPPGFARVHYTPQSFSSWLQVVRLKKDKTVYTFNGSQKYNQSAQFAVIDITVGNKDLQQCADAIMRLRAEYLFSLGKFEGISFTDNRGKTYSFLPPYNRLNFSMYLDKVFSMCGSASLSKQLKNKSFQSVMAGDVLIRGGFPGHAVIVMDVAVNSQGKKIYLIAQSYMPAQDIHVLVNPSNKKISPWYEVDDAEIIETPEYIFTKNELKTW
jgi:hypothetical protein